MTSRLPTSISNPRAGLLLQNIKGSRLKNAHIDASVGEPIITDGAIGDLNGKTYGGSGGGSRDPFYRFCSSLKFGQLKGRKRKTIPALVLSHFLSRVRLGVC